MRVDVALAGRVIKARELHIEAKAHVRHASMARLTSDSRASLFLAEVLPVDLCGIRPPEKRESPHTGTPDDRTAGAPFWADAVAAWPAAGALRAVERPRGA